MSAARIPVIGIVGGVGSGKSALANALEQHFRCGRLDADGVGHRALQQPRIKSSLRSTFGDSIFDSSGEVSRPELAQLVFGDSPEKQAARTKLENIVHPVIRREIIEQLDEHQRQLDCDLILMDAALLLESGWSNDCDAIIYIDVPESIRRQRVEGRGWKPGELERREASQMALEEKKSRADLIVDNSGTVEKAAQTATDWICERFQIDRACDRSVPNEANSKKKNTRNNSVA